MELKSIYDAIVNGDVQETQNLIQGALADGVSAETILHEALIPAMTQVGCLFEAQEYYVPEMLVSAKAMQTGMKHLKPLLANEGAQADGQPSLKAACGTVKGDLHDIGKDLVVTMLEGAGFQVTDLGVDVPPEKFIEAIHEHVPNCVADPGLLRFWVYRDPGDPTRFMFYEDWEDRASFDASTTSLAPVSTMKVTRPPFTRAWMRKCPSGPVSKLRVPSSCVTPWVGDSAPMKRCPI